ncbi:hypothetical protein AUK22_03755 [bacterium CG2_30_54_10]|nr:MAG: hypothetical protein AUK22_03755 [bacterium CG2_30_54_10]
MRLDRKAGDMVGGFRRAMTLLELLVVLSLLSLVVGLVLPDFAARLQLTRLERFSHRLDLLFRECFHSAVFSGTARWVVMTPGKGIEVHERVPEGPLIQTPFLRSFLLPDWISLEGFEHPWCASSEGFCDAGPFLLRDNKTGDRVTLRIRPYDGEIVNP